LRNHCLSSTFCLLSVMHPHSIVCLLNTGLFWAFLIAGCTGNPRQQPKAEEGTPLPEPTRAQSTPAFSGQRAYGFLLNQTSFGPRNPNSKGHKECLGFLATKLRTCAREVRLQDFSHTGYGGEILRLTNIIAAFNAEAQPRILLCAHWDTRPRADQDPDPEKREKPILGANDGASGVAVLLELATLMKEDPPPIGVDLVLFDGEDYGTEGDHASYLLGSRYFARNRPSTYLPRFGILLDMVGDTYLELPREGYSVRYAPDIVDLVWNTARGLGISQFAPDVGSEIIDDHLPLNDAGIKTIDLIDFDYPDASNRFWHTHQDTPEHCSPQSLEAVGTVLTHLIYSQKP
jgi:glutaminyl-peptide cyclotransferase